MGDKSKDSGRSIPLLEFHKGVWIHFWFNPESVRTGKCHNFVKPVGQNLKISKFLGQESVRNWRCQNLKSPEFSNTINTVAGWIFYEKWHEWSQINWPSMPKLDGELKKWAVLVKKWRNWWSFGIICQNLNFSTTLGQKIKKYDFVSQILRLFWCILVLKIGQYKYWTQ